VVARSLWAFSNQQSAGGRHWGRFHLSVIRFSVIPTPEGPLDAATFVFRREPSFIDFIGPVASPGVETPG
jgi:hypothetical protein